MPSRFGELSLSPQTASVRVFNIPANPVSPPALKPSPPYARPRRPVTSAVLSHLLACLSSRRTRERRSNTAFVQCGGARLSRKLRI